MRTAPRIEDVGDPVVGKYYDIPMVIPKGRGWWTPKFVPINGPQHEDRDVIGFEPEHWHIDWRFVSAVFWQKLGFRTTDGAINLAERPADFVASSKVLSVENTEGPVFRARRKCIRSQFTFTAKAPWMARLEDAYKDASAKCMKCPHRGISLVGAPIVDGARVCPGHGLAWNVETGSLQRRAS